MATQRAPSQMIRTVLFRILFASLYNKVPQAQTGMARRGTKRDKSHSIAPYAGITRIRWRPGGPRDRGRHYAPHHSRTCVQRPCYSVLSLRSESIVYEEAGIVKSRSEGVEKEHKGAAPKRRSLVLKEGRIEGNITFCGCRRPGGNPSGRRLRHGPSWPCRCKGRTRAPRSIR